jgi:hypothetical protein
MIFEGAVCGSVIPVFPTLVQAAEESVGCTSTGVAASPSFATGRSCTVQISILRRDDKAKYLILQLG